MFVSPTCWPEAADGARYVIILMENKTADNPARCVTTWYVEAPQWRWWMRGDCTSARVTATENRDHPSAGTFPGSVSDYFCMGHMKQLIDWQKFKDRFHLWYIPDFYIVKVEFSSTPGQHGDVDIRPFKLKYAIKILCLPASPYSP